MRIGMFYKDFEAEGGFPRDFRKLATQLQQLGNDVYVYTYAEDSTSKKSKISGIKVRRFRHKLINSFFIPQELNSILKNNSDAIDILQIVGGYIPENIPVARAAQKGKIPYVVIPLGDLSPIVSSYKNKLIKFAFTHLFLLPILRKALAAQASSEIEKKWIEYYNIRTPIIVQGYLGIFKSDIPAVLQPNYLEKIKSDLKNKTKLVFLGRLDVFCKGLDLLILAYAMIVRNALRSELALVLIGPDWNNGRARLESLSKKYGVADNVFFLGPIYGQEKYSALADADLFLHPSRMDNQPRSVREALGVGCPVIVTKETCIGELIERYDAGAVVELSARSICKKVISLIRNTKKLARMRENAKMLSTEELDWAKIAQKLCLTYDKYLGIKR